MGPLISAKQRETINLLTSHFASALIPHWSEKPQISLC